MPENITENIDDDKKNEEIKIKKKKKRLIRDIIYLMVKIVFIGIVYFVLLYVLFGAKRMTGNAMVPYLFDGDLLFYYRLDKKYNTDDIVIVKQNNNEYILRIVAKEGQTVDINEYGQLIVDGVPETHMIYYETAKDDKSNINYPYTVPKNCFFALNDYRKVLNDSRSFGPISVENIKGKLIGKLQIRNF